MPSWVALEEPIEPKPIFFGADDVADFPPPTCPKPNLPTPIPNLSTSLGLRWCPCAPKPPLGGLIGIGAAILGFSTGDLIDVCATASSASGSYPSFSIRSASSFAFFSAASKSMASAPVTFFAPSFCVFFAPSTLAFRGAPVVVLLRIAEDEIVRDAVGGASADSLSIRGVFGLPFPFTFGFKKGEAVRLMTGGV